MLKARQKGFKGGTVNKDEHRKEVEESLKLSTTYIILLKREIFYIQTLTTRNILMKQHKALVHQKKEEVPLGARALTEYMEHEVHTKEMQRTQRPKET